MASQRVRQDLATDYECSEITLCFHDRVQYFKLGKTFKILINIENAKSVGKLMEPLYLSAKHAFDY